MADEKLQSIFGKSDNDQSHNQVSFFDTIGDGGSSNVCETQNNFFVSNQVPDITNITNQNNFIVSDSLMPVDLNNGEPQNNFFVPNQIPVEQVVPGQSVNKSESVNDGIDALRVKYDSLKEELNECKTTLLSTQHFMKTMREKSINTASMGKENMATANITNAAINQNSIDLAEILELNKSALNKANIWKKAVKRKDDELASVNNQLHEYSQMNVDFKSQFDMILEIITKSVARSAVSTLIAHRHRFKDVKNYDQMMILVEAYDKTNNTLRRRCDKLERKRRWHRRRAIDCDDAYDNIVQLSQPYNRNFKTDRLRRKEANNLINPAKMSELARRGLLVKNDGVNSVNVKDKESAAKQFMIDNYAAQTVEFDRPREVGKDDGYMEQDIDDGVQKLVDKAPKVNLKDHFQSTLAIEVASRQPKIMPSYHAKPSQNVYEEPMPIESNFLFGEYTVLKSQGQIAVADKLTGQDLQPINKAMLSKKDDYIKELTSSNIVLKVAIDKREIKISEMAKKIHSYKSRLNAESLSKIHNDQKLKSMQETCANLKTKNLKLEKKYAQMKELRKLGNKSEDFLTEESDSNSMMSLDLSINTSMLNECKEEVSDYDNDVTDATDKTDTEGKEEEDKNVNYDNATSMVNITHSKRKSRIGKNYAPDVIPNNTNFNKPKVSRLNKYEMQEKKLCEAFADARREAEFELNRQKHLAENSLNLDVNQFYHEDHNDDITDVDELNKMVTDLKKTNASLEQDIENLNADHRIARNDLQKKIMLLRTSCQEDGDKIEKLEDICKSLTTEIQELSKTSNLPSRGKVNMKGDFEISTSNANGHQNIINGSVDDNNLEINSLVSSSSTNNISKSSKELVTLEAENKQLLFKISDYERQKTISDDNMNLLKSNCSCQKDKLGVAQNQLIDLQQTIDKKDVEINSIKNEILNSDELSSRIQMKYQQDMESSIQELENKAIQLNKVSDKLMKNEDEIHKLCMAIQKYKDNEEKYKLDLDRIDILEKKLEKSEILLDESNTKLLKKTAILSELKTNFESEINNLKTTSNSENSDINNLNKKHDISIASLQKEIVWKQDLIDSQNLKITKLMNDYDLLEKTITSSSNDIDLTEVYQNDLTNIMEKNKIEINDLKEKIAESERLLESSKKDQIQQLSILEGEFNSTNADLIVKMNKLREDYEESEKRNDQLTSEYNDSKNCLQDSEKRFTELLNKFEKLESQSEITISELKDTCRELNDKFERETDQLTQHKIKFEEVDIEKETLKVQLMNLSEIETFTKKKMETLNNLVIKLKDDNKELTNSNMLILEKQQIEIDENNAFNETLLHKQMEEHERLKDEHENLVKFQMKELETLNTNNKMKIEEMKQEYDGKYFENQSQIDKLKDEIELLKEAKNALNELRESEKEDFLSLNSKVLEEQQHEYDQKFNENEILLKKHMTENDLLRSTNETLLDKHKMDLEEIENKNTKSLNEQMDINKSVIEDKEIANEEIKSIKEEMILLKEQIVTDDCLTMQIEQQNIELDDLKIINKSVCEDKEIANEEIKSIKEEMSLLKEKIVSDECLTMTIEQQNIELEQLKDINKSVIEDKNIANEEIKSIKEEMILLKEQIISDDCLTMKIEQQNLELEQLKNVSEEHETLKLEVADLRSCNETNNLQEVIKSLNKEISKLKKTVELEQSKSKESEQLKVERNNKLKGNLESEKFKVEEAKQSMNLECEKLKENKTKENSDQSKDKQLCPEQEKSADTPTSDEHTRISHELSTMTCQHDKIKKELASTERRHNNEINDLQQRLSKLQSKSDSQRQRSQTNDNKETTRLNQLLKVKETAAQKISEERDGLRRELKELRSAVKRDSKNKNREKSVPAEDQSRFKMKMFIVGYVVLFVSMLIAVYTAL